MTLSFHFTQKLSDFLLDASGKLPEGEICGLFGTNASGKTSLLRCLAGISDARGEGSLKLNDQVIEDSKDFMPAWKRPLTYLSQRPQLLPHLSVRKNIEFAHARATSEAVVALEELYQRFKIKHLLDASVQKLSGGELQRVVLVRALASARPWLLMDEPFSAIAESSRFELLSELKRYVRQSKQSVFMVSHDRRELAQVCDYLMIIESGQIVAEGPFMELATELGQSFAEQSHALSIMEGILTEEQDGDLRCVDVAGQSIWTRVEGGRVNESCRIHIPANEISISLKPLENTSMLNHLAGEIIEIGESHAGHRLVKIKAAEHQLLINLTERSINNLNLNVGLNCYCHFKAVAGYAHDDE